MDTTRTFKACSFQSWAAAATHCPTSDPVAISMRSVSESGIFLPMAV